MMFLLKVWRDMGVSEESLEYLAHIKVYRSADFWMAITF